MEECFEYPDFDVDENLHIRIEDVIVFLQTHKLCAPYFSSISQAFGAGDSSDLFKIEGGLLKELAELDFKLAQLENAGEVEDRQLYVRERGGDAAACIVPGVPGLEEVRIPSAEGEVISLLKVLSETAAKPGSAAAAEAIQRARRTKRAMQSQAERQKGGLADAACFARDYRRVDAVDDGQVSWKTARTSLDSGLLVTLPLLPGRLCRPPPPSSRSGTSGANSHARLMAASAWTWTS